MAADFVKVFPVFEGFGVCMWKIEFYVVHTDLKLSL